MNSMGEGGGVQCTTQRFLAKYDTCSYFLALEGTNRVQGSYIKFKLYLFHNTSLWMSPENFVSWGSPAALWKQIKITFLSSDPIIDVVAQNWEAGDKNTTYCAPELLAKTHPHIKKLLLSLFWEQFL